MHRPSFTILIVGITLIFSSHKALSQATRLLAKADSLTQAEAFEEAIQFLEDFIQDYPNRKMDQARAYFLISYNYMQLGQYDLAERSNNQSFRIRTTLGSDEVGENYMRTGSLLLLKGDYEGAFDNLFKARELPTDDPQIYALINGYIASAFTELGNQEKALEHYRESLEILEIELGEDHPDVATSYYNIGKVHLAGGQTENAKENLQKALQLELAHHNRKHQLGNIYNAQGILTFQSEEKEGALKLHQKALEAFYKAYGEKHRETARTQLNIARVQLSLGNQAEAQKQIQAALISLSINFQDNDFSKNPARNEIVLDRILMLNALNLKSASLILDYETGSDIDALKKALKSSVLGIQFLEDHLDILTGEASKLRLLDDASEIFETGILAASKLFEQTKDISYAEKAFELAEKAKAQVLRTNIIPMIEAGNEYAMARRLERRTRSFIQEAELALQLNPNDQKLWQRLREKRKAYKQFLKQLKSKQPEYYNLRYNHEVVPPATLQELLGEKEVLLSYFTGPTQYYIFAISKDGFEIHRLDNDFAVQGEQLKTGMKNLQKKQKGLGSGVGIYSKLDIKTLPIPPLEEATAAYLSAIKKLNSSNFVIYSNSLYGKLIFPVQSMLKGKEKLIIIPHGKLNFIPFEALISEIGKPDKVKYHKLDYLVKNYELQYQHSATLYAKLHQSGNLSPGQAPSFLGMAPVFKPEDQSGYIWNSHDYIFDTTYQQVEALREISPGGKKFSPLQYSENEIVSIAALLAKQQFQSTAYLHGKATEDEFKKQVEKYKFLHIASHSFVNEANPMLSGIVFAQPSEANPKEDGILYAPEIYGLDTKADLVVLSSCDSGTGRLVSSEGVLSLSRAFQEAGVNNVLSSLWKVYDQYTGQLMVSFYEYFLNGKAYSRALREAKLNMIKDKSTAAPRKWAGFILIGN